MFLNVVFSVIFSWKDLMIRSLADRIHDCPQMSLLYPSIPKDQGGGSTFSLNIKQNYIIATCIICILYQYFEAKLSSYHIF
jgi:hypothetical protein